MMMMMMMMMVVVVMVVEGVPSPQSAGTTTTTPSSSFIITEPCPKVELGTTFNDTAFGGLWYRFGGLPNIQELSTNCTTYDYQYTGSGFVVNEEGVGEKGERVSQTNTLTQPVKGVGEFVTMVDGLEAKLQILNTDYVSHACLYTCHTVRDTHRVHFAWILSRQPTLAKEEIANCQVLLKEVKVPLLKLEKTNHGPECQ